MRRASARKRRDSAAVHPAASSVYLKVGVDGGDLAGAAGRHAGPDDPDGRVRGRLLLVRVCGAPLSIAGQPGGAAACLQGEGGKGRQGDLAYFSFELSSIHITLVQKVRKGGRVG